MQPVLEISKMDEFFPGTLFYFLFFFFLLCSLSISITCECVCVWCPFYSLLSLSLSLFHSFFLSLSLTHSSPPSPPLSFFSFYLSIFFFSYRRLAIYRKDSTCLEELLGKRVLSFCQIQDRGWKWRQPVAELSTMDHHSMKRLPGSGNDERQD